MKRLLLFFALLLSIASLQAMHKQQQIKQDIQQLLHKPKESSAFLNLLDEKFKQLEDKNYINTFPENNDTLLNQEIIADDCNPEIVEVLLNNGADPIYQTGKGETALHLAIRRKPLESKGNDAENEKATNNQRILELLLSHKRKATFINILDHDRNSPLLQALQNKCPIDVIKPLILAGANIYHKTKDGESVIHLVGRYYDPSEGKEIIDTFVKEDDTSTHKNLKTRLIDEPDINGETPLMQAVSAHIINPYDERFCRIVASPELFRILIAHKPKIDAIDKKGEIAFHKLLKSHKYWLGREGECYRIADQGKLGIEIRQKQLIEDIENILTTLLKLDATQVDKSDFKCNTPLMIVQERPKESRPNDNDAIVKIMSLLIANKANVNAKNNAGDTFINHLIKSSNWLYPTLDKIIEAIPEAQRKNVIDEPDNEGNKPLINAIGKELQYFDYNHNCSWFHFPIGTLLIYGADPNAKRKEQSALEIAYDFKKIKAEENKATSFGSPSYHYYPEASANLLWKYNPENKWSIYRKCYPFRFYSTVAGITTGVGLAGYGAWRIASSYFGWQTASVYTPLAKLFNKNT